MLLIIEDSSEDPMPTEYGGELEEIRRGGTAKAPNRVIVEADAGTELLVAQGGKIKKIKKPSKTDRRWFNDDKNNLLQARQWVYEIILGAGLLMILICFLVVIISSVRQGKLDFQSFLKDIGTFLGGLGVGHVAGQRGGSSRPRHDGDEERKKRGGDDTG